MNKAGMAAGPWWIAAHQGREGGVGLVEAGAEVNKADNDGATPLWIAAHQGHEAVVRGLVEAGAEVNKADNDDRTRGSPRTRVTRRWCGGCRRRGRTEQGDG